MKLTHMFTLSTLAMLTLSACGQQQTTPTPKTDAAEAADHVLVEGAEQRLDIYQSVDLTADLSHLSDEQKQLIGLLIDASDIMDDLFWQQAFPGHKAELINAVSDDEVREFVDINYGPWDRLNNNQPFLTGLDPSLKAQIFIRST